jgi:hypothetical protein
VKETQNEKITVTRCFSPLGSLGFFYPRQSVKMRTGMGLWRLNLPVGSNFMLSNQKLATKQSCKQRLHVVYKNARFLLPSASEFQRFY